MLEFSGCEGTRTKKERTYRKSQSKENMTMQKKPGMTNGKSVFLLFLDTERVMKLSLKEDQLPQKE